MTTEPDSTAPDEPSPPPPAPSWPTGAPEQPEPVELALRPRSAARIRLLAYPADPHPDLAIELPMTSETYEDALATPITEAEDSSRQLLGAVYTRDGRLVGASQRGKSNAAWSGNPETLPGPYRQRVEDVPGRTYFGGHYRGSFGHVLLEMLPRFWPDLAYSSYDTLLFHPQRAGRRSSRLELEPYARDLLEAATGGPLPALRIVGRRPLRLEEVTVSSPGFWLKRGFSAGAREVFGRVATRLAPESGAAGQDPPRKLYLSRSRLHGRERRAENEDEIERLVAAAGFTVVHPQELSVGAQVALVRAAEVIAGCDGSAMHLGVFARAGTRLVAIDARPVPNQFLVDELAGLDAVHVLAAADDTVHGRSDRWRADLGRVRAALAVAGVD